MVIFATGILTPKILQELRARTVNRSLPSWSLLLHRYITEACTTQAHLQQIPLAHINIAGSIERLCNVSQVRDEPAPGNPRQRPVSDGVMYGNFNERRIEYEEVLLSERTTESQYSQSESYLSERYIPTIATMRQRT